MRKQIALLCAALIFGSGLISSCAKQTENTTSSDNTDYKEILAERVSAKTGGEALSSEVTVLSGEEASSYGLDMSSLAG